MRAVDCGEAAESGSQPAAGYGIAVAVPSTRRRRPGSAAGESNRPATANVPSSTKMQAREAKPLVAFPRTCDLRSGSTAQHRNSQLHTVADWQGTRFSNVGCTAVSPDHRHAHPARWGDFHTRSGEDLQTVFED
nr:hypothetical protein CFP56_32214 [Quercus suber]